MDYREHLRQPLSKRFVDVLAVEIFLNPADFDIVYQLIFDENEKVAWRAAWACQKISEKYPEWFSDRHFEELSALSIATSHHGLLRGCLSVINNIALPECLSVEFINACFDWMISAKSPIAVQALSMKILLRICHKEPEFKQELSVVLENIDFENYSAGFKSVRKNILNALKGK